MGQPFISPSSNLQVTCRLATFKTSFTAFGYNLLQNTNIQFVTKAIINRLLEVGESKDGLADFQVGTHPNRKTECLS